IVRTHLEAANLVGFFSLRRKNEDGSRMALLAQRSQNAKTVQLRQHQIEDQQIGIGPGESLQPGSAIFSSLDLLAFNLQVVAQTERQVAIVFNHEDAAHRETSG